MPTLIILAVVGVLVAVATWAAYVGNKKRNAAVQVVAQTMGFTYLEVCTPADLAPVVGDVPVFKRGHSHKTQRMMRGRLADRDAVILDYTYTIGSGKNSHTARQTVVVFGDGARGLPDFDLSPESVFHRIAEVFGAQDINFEQNAEFSKLYLLRGPDEAAIRKVFTTDALAYFAGSKGWQVQARHGPLAIFKEGTFVQPAEIPAYAAEALRITGLFART